MKSGAGGTPSGGAAQADGRGSGLRKRHTYASLLIQNGESLAYVQEMGHHSTRVTVDTYGHLVPGGNRAAVDRLDDPAAATIRNPSATYAKASTGWPA